MSGRARDNRLVHFNPVARVAAAGPAAPAPPRPGDLVTTVVTTAAPHYLLADGVPLAIRRTRGGDAWAARQGQAAQPAAAPVLLGMPTMTTP
jgi:tRNA-2-methylthio-N6-dimethylallyladenosine synthase